MTRADRPRGQPSAGDDARAPDGPPAPRSQGLQLRRREGRERRRRRTTRTSRSTPTRTGSISSSLARAPRRTARASRSTPTPTPRAASKTRCSVSRSPAAPASPAIKSSTRAIARGAARSRESQKIGVETADPGAPLARTRRRPLTVYPVKRSPAPPTSRRRAPQART